jgi:hypothetical protein
MSNPESGPATIEDVQRACGLGRTATRNAVLRGELPARKIGGKYVSRWEWIHAWERGEWPPMPQPTPIFRTPGPTALKRKAS